MSNNRRAIAECKSFIESVGKLKTDAMIWKETEKATHSGLVISSLPFVAPHLAGNLGSTDRFRHRFAIKSVQARRKSVQFRSVALNEYIYINILYICPCIYIYI